MSSNTNNGNTNEDVDTTIMDRVEESTIQNNDKQRLSYETKERY